MLGKTLTGGKTHISSQNSDNSVKNFSIVIYADTLPTTEDAVIMNIPGNQKTSFELSLNGSSDSKSKTENKNENTTNYFSVKFGDDTARYDSPPVFLNNNNIYFYEYDGNYLTCYINDSKTPLWKFETKSKLYFNTPMQINPGGKWNADLSAFMYYTKVISHMDRVSIVNYLRNEEKTKTKSKIEEYMFQSCLPLSKSVMHDKLNYNTNMKDPNNNNIEVTATPLPSSAKYNGSNSFKTTLNKRQDLTLQQPLKYDPSKDLKLDITLDGNDPNTKSEMSLPSSNNNGGDGTRCITTCIEACSKKHQHNGMYDYLDCSNKCKTEIPECYNYCNNYKDHSEENKPKMCQTMDLKDVMQSAQCPKVYQQNGSYYVHTPESSSYSSRYGNTAITKNYGSSKKIARETYAQNYPNCVMADALQDNTIVDHSKCPYIIDEGNPCTSSSCAGVNWDADALQNARLSNNCKRDINHYCRKNKDSDPQCKCWTAPYKHDSDCSVFRRQFETPHDKDCDAGSHSIESHPDYSKYIKKDEIPCWNCNLD